MPLKTNRLLLLGSLIAAALALATAGDALVAQPLPPDESLGAMDGDADAGETPEAMRERLRERVRIMRAWRLTEALDLDEATAVRLFDHLDAYDRRIEPLQDELATLGRRLREDLAATTADEDAIHALVEQVLETHVAIETLRAEVVREAGTFLDARQQAALMLFLPDFERHIQELMREARGRPGRGERMRGPGGGSGPPGEGRRGERRRRRMERWDTEGMGEGSE